VSLTINFTIDWRSNEQMNYIQLLHYFVTLNITILSSNNKFKQMNNEPTTKLSNRSKIL